MTMSKQELTDQHDYFVRKRDEYEDKIARNSALQQYIHNLLQQCGNESDKLGTYSSKAQVFQDLKDENSKRFSKSLISSVDGIFADLAKQLEVEISGAQSQVDNYKTLMDTYKEEKKR